MTTRGAFDKVLKPGGRMPKGKGYGKAATPSKEKPKKEMKLPVKRPPMRSPRKVAV